MGAMVAEKARPSFRPVKAALLGSLGLASLVLSAVVTPAATQAPAHKGYSFASGFEEIIPSVRTTFSCEGRIYGYYADVDNDCKVFHVCSPSVDDNGKILGMAHYSFFCGNQTMFNQESLTCADPVDALPCNEAPNLYEIKNLEFGIIPLKKTGN